jgi:hypothetical protein
VAVRNAGARLRRSVAVLAALIVGLLASAATVPAAFAMIPPDPGGAAVPAAFAVVPDPGGAGGSAGVAPVPAHSVRVVVTGGIAAWQVTLIALGAALAAAVAAVLLYRVLAVRKAASAATV